MGFAGAHPHTREQSRVQTLTGLCKQPNAWVFLKKEMVVECLVDLEVNLRRREQSAALYI